MESVENSEAKIFSPRISSRKGSGKKKWGLMGRADIRRSHYEMSIFETLYEKARGAMGNNDRL
ncbi:hypothetical protein GCM10007096_05500 [Pullulanibacillus pueri]|uniref:Uncharacterized protein n=1 Tax=Pullulanibacillus pueri TaxID=1437324 RepID=A0A8J2ZST7_9BACL|nr:hypothetical protein GCM10007096_05500 [Pullulanibacillus pueri]